MKIVTTNVSSPAGNPGELDVTFSLQGFKQAEKVATLFATLQPLVATKQPITPAQLLIIVAGLLID